MLTRATGLTTLAITMLMGAGAAHAATRHVATTGINTGDCTTAACHTIQYAVDHAQSGDTIAIAAGVYAEAVTDDIPLTFTGAGASTPYGTGAASVELGTFVDAGAQHGPAFTVGDNAATFSGLAVRGGVASDGGGGEVLPAIQGGGASAPALTLSHVLAEQSDPINPDQWDHAIGIANSAGTAQLTVADSTIDGYQAAIGVTAGAGGSVVISHSTITVPQFPASETEPQGDVISRVPTTIDDSTLQGYDPIVVRDAPTSIDRTTIEAAGDGLLFRDQGSGAAVSVRDSIFEPAQPADALTSAFVDESDAAPGVATPPTLSFAGDSIVTSFADDGFPGFDLSHARPGTLITISNSALIGGLLGGPALSWNVDASAFTTSYGAGVPAPGSGTNLDVKPDFVDAAHGNLHLTASSPLLDGGDPGVVLPGELDIAGAPRAIDHDCNDVAQPDIGAYEAATTCRYQPAATATPQQVGVVTPALNLHPTTPTLTHVSLSRGRFTAHHGATLRYTLNEDHTHVLGIVERVHHHHHGADTFTRVGIGWSEHEWAGSFVALFQGEYELPGHLAGYLKAGDYRLVLTATDKAGRVSAARHLRFTIVAG